MDTTGKAGKRLHHIDGLKGLCCFFIMFSHFWLIYARQSAPAVLNSSLWNRIGYIYLTRYFFSAEVWLYGFYVFSGYLLSSARITSLFELALKSALRYLRLFLPVLGACCFILVIQETIGFHTGETSAYFTNPWYQNGYSLPLTPADIFSEAKRALSEGMCRFNDPYWVLKDIFHASLMIYVCSFADHILQRIFQKRIPILPAVFLAAAWLQQKFFVIAFLGGYLTGIFREQIDQLIRKKTFLWIIGVVLAVFFGYHGCTGFLPVLINSIPFFICIWCVTLVLFHRFEALQNAFSGRFFRFLGQLNFGVYSFHWPVLCSVGALVMLAGLERQWDPGWILLATLAISVLCTVLIAWIYSHTVERICGWITAKLALLLRKAWSRITSPFRRVWEQITSKFR